MHYISQQGYYDSNLTFPNSSTDFAQFDIITEGTQEINESNQYTSSINDNITYATYEHTIKPERSRFYGFYFTRIIIIPYLIICIILCLICLVIDIILLTNFGILNLISPSILYTVCVLFTTICFNVIHLIIYIVILIFGKELFK